MSLTVCPAAVVAAPVEVIWENLIYWERYPEWFDRSLQVERCKPEGPATVGQTIIFASKALGRTWRFTFTVEGVNPERHQLALHASFPLSLQMRPHISCTPIDASTCHVQYGWDFIFPPGWWGRFLETYGAKRFENSVEDSLRRLKRASERQYQQTERK